MSVPSPGFGMSHMDTIDDMEFFLGTELNFDTLYPTPSLPNNGLAAVERQQPGQNTFYSRASRSRSSLACTQCRSRHLKCDAKPVCSRCEVDQLQCLYTKSRRGGNRRQNASQAARDPSIGAQSLIGAVPLSDFEVNAPPLPQTSDHVFNVDTPPRSQLHIYAEAKERAKRLELYYENFHIAHPIVLPRSQLEARLKVDPDSIGDLILVLECIGSVYEGKESLDITRQAAHHALIVSSLPSNGFSVQSLLLYALAVHYFDDHVSAEIILSKAIEMALGIELCRQHFAQAHGENDTMLQESWRRTAWFLFNTDAVFAAIRHNPAHTLQNILIDVDLPCEDHEYESGNIPLPRTLTDYDNREFEEDEIVFSSFAYFIDVGRILSDTLTITQECRDPNESRLHAADARIVTWFLHLPESKQEITRESGEVDELMFLAHLWINTEKLLLHRPYSQLQYHSMEAGSRCTPNAQTRASRKSMTLHTTKTLQAIEAAFQLFTLPSPDLRHSPIVTCSLALFIMAQVSACTHVFRPGKNGHVDNRQKIRLGLGVLKRYKKYWLTAQRSENEVKGLAKQLLESRVAVATGSSNDNRVGDETFTEDHAYSSNATL